MDLQLWKKNQHDYLFIHTCMSLFKYEVFKQTIDFNGYFVVKIYGLNLVYIQLPKLYSIFSMKRVAFDWHYILFTHHFVSTFCTSCTIVGFSLYLNLVILYCYNVFEIIFIHIRHFCKYRVRSWSFVSIQFLLFFMCGLTTIIIIIIFAFSGLCGVGVFQQTLEADLWIKILDQFSTYSIKSIFLVSFSHVPKWFLHN